MPDKSITRTQPDIEKLRKQGMQELQQARAGLEKDGNFMPMLVLGDAADGTGNILVAAAGDVMNSGTAKDAFSAYIKGLIAKHGFFHAILLVDTFALRLGEDEKSDWGKVRQLQNAGMGLPEIHKKTGIGKLVEQILVSIETIDQSLLLMQQYERDKDGKCINFGEVVETPVMYSGRMKFFGNDNDRSQN